MTENNASKVQNREVALVDYLEVVFRYRRMIARNTFLVAVAVAVISLLLPSAYTAKTTLLPPDDRDEGGLQSLLSNSAVPFLDIPGASGTRSSDVFVEILNSRSVGEGVLAKKYEYRGEKHDLYSIWDTKSREKALTELAKRARIYASEQGIITISVELEDPHLAAQVANAYPDELDRINQQKSVSKAKNSRVYIEDQLHQTEKKLREVSAELAKFQAEYKAVNLEEQTRVAIEKAGEIKGTILAKEVEIEVMLQTMKRDNPIVERLQKELEELRKQFEHLQFGNSIPFEEQRDYFIPFADVPEVGLKLAAILREVKVQETVWQLLNQQYYRAKIQEARDTPTVQVLDEATAPEERTSPKRRLMVLMAAILAICGSVVWAFVLEYHEKLKSRQDEYHKVEQLVAGLKSDYDDLKNMIRKIWHKMPGRR